jgi:hypothetical protein
LASAADNTVWIMVVLSQGSARGTLRTQHEASMKSQDQP